RRARAARRPGDPDDRQGAVAGVLQQPRLARRLGAGDSDAGTAAGADHPVPLQPVTRDGVVDMMRPDSYTVVPWCGLLFLYLLMVILVIYSFNASRLVTVWGGWSVHWYVGLLDNTQLMGAVKRSLQIAFYTATAAVVLGTMAAFAMTRIRHFRGRTLFSGMVTAPLVMPEVITGLPLLLLFVAMAQVGRASCRERLYAR